MHEIEQLKDKLCRELEEYSKCDRFNMQSLQIIDMISHTVKNLNKILEEKSREDSGYSEGYFYGNNRQGNYSNGRMHVNYASHYPDWDRGMNGYNNGYSMNNSMMIDRLRSLMNETRDERTRNEFQNFINRMEQM